MPARKTAPAPPAAPAPAPVPETPAPPAETTPETPTDTAPETPTESQALAAGDDGQEQGPAEAGPARDPVYVAALLRERAGYVRHGLTKRTAAVDAELQAIGAPAADKT